MTNYLLTINGVIYNSDSKIIVAFLKQFYETFSFKIRVIGYDIYIDDGKTKAFITSPDADEQTCYLDIKFRGSDTEREALIRKYKDKLIESDLLFDICFCMENLNDGITSLEEEFRHPDFNNRYIPPIKI